MQDICASITHKDTLIQYPQVKQRNTLNPFGACTRFLVTSRTVIQQPTRSVDHGASTHLVHGHPG